MCPQDKFSTVRHNAVRDIICDMAQRAGCIASTEPSVGTFIDRVTGSPTAFRADVKITSKDTEYLVDVGITGVEKEFLRAGPVWPSDAEVDRAVTDRRTNAAQGPLILRLADRLHPNEEVLKVQAFRELAIAASVGKALRRMSRRKMTHYESINVPVVLFILSPGGFLDSVGLNLVDTLAGLRAPLDDHDHKWYHADFLARLGVSLIVSGCRAAWRHTNFADQFG